MNVIPLLRNRATITGLSVGSTDDFRDMIAAVEANNMKPVIDSTFLLEQFIQAFIHLESGKHFGKVVIEL